MISFRENYTMHLLLRLLIAASTGIWLPVAAYCQDHSPAVAKDDLIDSNAEARAFAPGVVSSRFDEWGTSFSPDNKTVYFSRGSRFWTVCFSRNRDGAWQRPEVASFSGLLRDTDPFVSPDGTKLFFTSNRPLVGAVQDKPNSNFHLWYVERTGSDQWGRPHHVDGRVNIDSSNDYAPCVSARGTLYWCSRDREGNKGMQGYYAIWLGDHYDEPKMLHIAGVEFVQDPFVSADEKCIVFLNGSDIYVAFRQGEGWSVARKLGPQVNTGDGNSSPYVSHDGKMLFFSSPRTKGFYDRDRSHALNYDELEKENDSWCNSSDNILMIPIHL
jgi:Tol biopolymer transport system component